jgi:cardiolipin synthase
VTLSRELAWFLGEIATVLHIGIALAVSIHVLQYKRTVGSAISWMGIAWLSPFIGGALYFALGINRVRRRALRLRNERAHLFASNDVVPTASDADPLTPLEFALGKLTGLPAEGGNAAHMLRSGDNAYPAMLAAIDEATQSVGLASYIFRDDVAGGKFIAALIRAHERGVAVRVLIDGVGGGWFWSGTYMKLRKAGVPVSRFLHSYFPWRTPFLNLRNHRKILVIDGKTAFVGGINIGDENVLASHPRHPVRDTHFRFDGPVVDQLTEAFADDWLFQTGEKLLDETWFPPIAAVGSIEARCISSGPDEEMEQIEFAALHAISCARHSIRVVTPYFLPPDVLTTALSLAAMRGLKVEIVLPEESNHRILDWGRAVPLRNLLAAGCHVWLRPGPFDHSKLMTIDDAWSMIGSANWDTRSFRLNFELNVEVHGPEFARQLVDVTRGGRRLTLAELDSDPISVKLRNSAARLLQPYL